jgi:hypothetical protein
MVNMSGFRPENVLFAGRLKVKETLARTQAGLTHGTIATRDAAVLASSAALSGPGTGLAATATLLATDGFVAGKANQMVVGMLNFSNAPQTAQFLAQNHNLAMVGGAALGLGSLYASKYPIGFLNRQASSLSDLYPNAKASNPVSSNPVSSHPVSTTPAPTVVTAPVPTTVTVQTPAAPADKPTGEPAQTPTVPAPALKAPDVQAPPTPAETPAQEPAVSQATLPTPEPVLNTTFEVPEAEKPVEALPAAAQAENTQTTTTPEATVNTALAPEASAITEPAPLAASQTDAPVNGGSAKSRLGRIFAPVTSIFSRILPSRKKPSEDAAPQAPGES